MTTAESHGIDPRRAAARGVLHGLAIAALLVGLLYQVASTERLPFGDNAGSGGASMAETRAATPLPGLVPGR